MARAGKLDHAVIGVRANVFRHAVKSVAGQEQLIRSRILNADVIARYPVNGKGFKPHIAADTVCLVHHEIAHLQLGIGKDLPLSTLFLFGVAQLTRGGKTAVAQIGSK